MHKKIIITLGTALIIFSTLTISPLDVKAQNLTDCSALKLGDNIKSNLINERAIWNIGSDKKLRPFLDGDDFKTWHADDKYDGHFKLVKPDCLASYTTANQLPLYIGRRPGSGLIKKAGDTQLYAILPNNTKAPITTESAKALYGTNYTTREIDFASFHNYYNIAPKISGANPQPHSGMFIKKDSTNYYVDVSNKITKLTSQILQNNNIKSVYVKTLNFVFSLVVGNNNLNSLADYAQTSSQTSIQTSTSNSGTSGSITAGGSGSSNSNLTVPTETNTTDSTTSNESTTNSNTNNNSNTSTDTSPNSSTSTATSTNSSNETTEETTTQTENATTTESNSSNESTTSTTDNTSSEQTDPSNNTGYTTYYIRTDGGTATQCTGKANTAYSGSGTNQTCAWNHPFIALPPEGSAKIIGGDTLIINNGNYKMGFGASAGAENCESSYPWDCNMLAVPSGPSADKPTKILGANYANGCSTKPQLYGTQRSQHILDLSDSSNIEVQCLEITDRSNCVEFHSGSITCNRNNYPYGDWASIGIIAEDSANVLLKNLNIHGLAHTGIQAGRLTDWTIDNTKIVANGWVGWDGDISGSDANLGTITFSDTNIDWNGCGETYPGLQPTGCWGQSAGGYGDGLGTGDTGGNWVFIDSTFLYNTSDGLDMLYHRSGGKITITRVHAEGNAGNQIKTTGSADITDSVVVGNCSYFEGKSFTHNVDACRALGNAFSIEPSGQTVNVYNNSVYSNGDGLLYAEGSGTVNIYNNIFYGGTDYWQPTQKSFYIYSEGGTSFIHDYNLVYNSKDNNNRCNESSNNICGSDPLFSAVGSSFNFVLNNSSPAIDKGTTPLTSSDFTGKTRPSSGVDIGAYEK